MDINTKESLKLVAIYAQSKLLVDRHEYHKEFPNEPSLGPDMENDNLPKEAVEQAGGIAEVHKLRADAIANVFNYLDSLEEETEE